MTVFAVIDKADTVTVFGNIGIFVCTNLKACTVPARVVMRGSLNRTELNIVCCLIGVYINGESRFKKYVRLLPINLCLKVNAINVVIKPNFLLNGAV